MNSMNWEERLKAYGTRAFPVVPFEKGDKLLHMDFTASNKALTADLVKDTEEFTRYINQCLSREGARYGIGGYNEYRTIYSRSDLFERSRPAVNELQHHNIQTKAEARCIHLGIDIWGKPYTKVIAPLDGIIHSFAFNNGFGDYGATIILTHNLEGNIFHTLYGHLSLNSIKNIQEGDRIKAGDVFAEFGIPFENGQWPPHLHFQLIIDMEGRIGDYPGVCAPSEKDRYLSNCPDPYLLLNLQ
ncbi:MAG TPA: peptidoglycan DD-metalloendopeptidase family protein [Flavisolibacter sp.]|nr:peptidoglycan DD-metalloendopeptidase family protein [Flavisolibacter sp.]